MSKKRTTYHVTKTTNGKSWQVKQEGISTPESKHRTQATATQAAVAKAKAVQQGQVIIHRPNGQFREERTFGDDPFPPAG